MQNPEYKQLKLDDEGRILFQQDPSNPLPGQPVAQIKKGASLLEPVVEPVIEGINDEGLEMLRAWLKLYTFTVLETLMPLSSELDPEGPARDIARKLYDALGIVLRADIEADIAKLDDEGRALLRHKKVRMGPILIFLPTLNKPAAVRLRALLWSLWNDKPLPALVPKDGATSVVVAEEGVDQAYFRMIGYPLYAGRAIRVDMLDRLVCDIYDCAKDGKFQAKHKMAEWLGCSVPHLYLVLEALGHKKTHDPADDVKPVEAVEAAQPAAEETKTPETPVEEKAAEALKTEAPVEIKAPVETKAPAEATPAAPAVVKPELATFALKKGRAYSGSRRTSPRPLLLDPAEKAARDKKRAEKKKSDDRSKKPFKKKFDKDKNKDRPDRVISAMAQKREEDSPFAALQNMKIKAGDEKK